MNEIRTKEFEQLVRESFRLAEGNMLSQDEGGHIGFNVDRVRVRLDSIANPPPGMEAEELEDFFKQLTIEAGRELLTIYLKLHYEIDSASTTARRTLKKAVAAREA